MSKLSTVVTMPRDGRTDAERLNDLTMHTLLEFERIMAVPLHAHPVSEWPMWLNAKLTAGKHLLAARLRVDEASLRKRELDVLPKLLERIRGAKVDNPALDL